MQGGHEAECSQAPGDRCVFKELSVASDSQAKHFVWKGLGTEVMPLSNQSGGNSLITRVRMQKQPASVCTVGANQTLEYNSSLQVFWQMLPYRWILRTSC